jgi:hypothetical protein
MKIKRQSTEWAQILTNHTPGKRLFYITEKKLYNSSIKKITIFKWTRGFHILFSKEDV